VGSDRVVQWRSGTAGASSGTPTTWVARSSTSSTSTTTRVRFNVGVGADVTIRELAGTVVDVVGFRGAIEQDLSRPDGTPRKLLDVSRIRASGW
jgi:GDP-L-fucose synthase